MGCSFEINGETFRTDSLTDLASSASKLRLHCLVLRKFPWMEIWLT